MSRVTTAASDVLPADGALRRRRGGWAGLHSRRINSFWIPAVALMVVFTGYPLVGGVVLSFQNWNGYSPSTTFAGLDNYARLMQDGDFHTALINTLIYAFGSTAIQQVLGLALAVMLDRAMKGRNLARAVIYLPALVSPVVMGTMYYLLFSYNTGAINDIVVALGGQRTAWLADSTAAIGVIVVVNSLQFVGISMIIYLAGLQSIDVSYEEAAMLDGATGWRRFTSITLPLLQPAFATSIVLNLIGGFQIYDVIVVLTGGGPGTSTNSLSTLITREYFANQSAGYASAIGVALFVIIILFTLVFTKILNRNRLEA